MATYKKKSNKLRKSRVSNQNSSTKKVFDTLDVSASKSEFIISKYQNYLLYSVLGLLVLFALYFTYDRYVVQPKINESNTEIFTAQKYFDMALNTTTDKDSLYNLALVGADGKFGFLDIIDNYKGTPAANLAYYSSGMAYYQLKKYDLAIEYLNQFSSDDDVLYSLSLSTIGDSFVQINQLDDALSYYEKAIRVSSNSFTKPIILQKAGDVAMKTGNNNKALKFFSSIKEDFPKSAEADLIDIKIEQVR
tara:strand:- start:3287 stop:4033 length:747 start_codon:yes stop_codon:yes gene_type:complete